ncbi:MAG: hypothetical protein WBN15_02815 [Polyangiales bacterium]
MYCSFGFIRSETVRRALIFATVLVGLEALPKSVSAEVVESATTSEPALQLKSDSAGVEVVPSPPPTARGDTLEEMDVRVRRARIGLLSTTGVTVIGVALFGAGMARYNSSEDLNDLLTRRNAGLAISGMAVMISGGVGMIASGIVLGLSKSKRRTLKESRHEDSRRARWDLETSRLVF